MTDDHAATPARTAIITGASSGIGAATARQFARKGWNVALAARREEKLQRVADACRSDGAPEALIVPTDVTDRSQVDALVRRTVEQLGRLDVMVNNAGYGLSGRVHELDESDLRDIFKTNFFGLWYGCAAAARAMVAQGSGHIFNVSSVIGRRGTPFNGAYCASKFAVSGLTESMRVELAPYGVRCTLVCPGLTETEFFDQVVGGSDVHKSSFKAVRGRQTPDVVARKIVASVDKNRPQLTFTAGGKILLWLNKRFPRLVDWMMGKYYRDVAAGQGIEIPD
jgi:short-subunit dehydrogenase